ncbi:MAG: hypothetical protein NTW32_04620 [Chloroflexi bacterium]|nr:hypothetical protein [Chloroflexota bacterium]
MTRSRIAFLAGAQVSAALKAANQKLTGWRVLAIGRYSLDKPGLVLANQGETLKDYLRKVESG